VNPTGGRVLVVDDERMNRMLARRPIEADGHLVLEAENGRQALEVLRSEPVDVVLLDLVMPELDGYATLEQIKADPALGHVPVIVVSAVDQLASVVRCIEMGATDYLTKPFEVAILRARLEASLAAKRLRDLELEYLEQVSRVTSAAAALETGAFDGSVLASVSAREDALGVLARRFASMASEVQAREERLRREVRELRIEIDHAKQARRVAEITDTDFFRDLRSRAGDLRRTIKADRDDPGSAEDG
jgi:two-component system cell cycle response regulator